MFSLVQIKNATNFDMKRLRKAHKIVTTTLARNQGKKMTTNNAIKYGRQKPNLKILVKK